MGHTTLLGKKSRGYELSDLEFARKQNIMGEVRQSSETICEAFADLCHNLYPAFFRMKFLTSKHFLMYRQPIKSKIYEKF